MIDRTLAVRAGQLHFNSSGSSAAEGPREEGSGLSVGAKMADRHTGSHVAVNA